MCGGKIMLRGIDGTGQNQIRGLGKLVWMICFLGSYFRKCSKRQKKRNLTENYENIRFSGNPSTATSTKFCRDLEGVESPPPNTPHPCWFINVKLKIITLSTN